MTSPSTIAGWLRYWARVRPNAPALLDSGAILTYAELRCEIERRATFLVGCGVGPGTIAVVNTYDKLEQRLLRWATNYLGATEAVLDPRLPHAEFNDRIERLAPVVALRDPLPQWGDATKLPPYLDDNHRARVLFTSGSTGAAKAVVHFARQLDLVARANIIARGLRRDDVYLAALPPFHAAGSLFEDSAIRLGAAIMLPDCDGLPGIAETLSRGVVTLTSLVPSSLRYLGDQIGFNVLSHLRLLNYAGEPMQTPLLKQLRNEFSGQLFRGYGATEAGPLISLLNDTVHRGTTPLPGNVGLPAPGVAVRIDVPDDDGVGELLVRSPWVMSGYLNDPEGTAALTIDGWLRTSDLACWRHGYIHLVGRLGTCICSGGEWIDPLAIEACLLQISSIKEAAVVAVNHPQWGQRPIAFVRLGDGGWPDPEELHRHLDRNLVKFAWPDRIHVLTDMPYTAAGKIDRMVLRRTAADPMCNRPLLHYSK